MSVWLTIIGAMAVFNLLLAICNFVAGKTELAVWQLNVALWMGLYIVEYTK